MKTSIHVVLLICLFFTPLSMEAQTTTGANFMRLAVGARQNAMGSTFTGVGDDIFTMLWNPAGLGLMHRWQFAAGIDQNIADTRMLSFMGMRQFNWLGSRKLALGAGFYHFDLGTINNTGSELAPSAWMGLASVAYRPDWWGWPLGIGKHLSVGGNFKYVRNDLDVVASTGMFADFGVILKPVRFRLSNALGLFDYGIFTLGASWQNLNLKKLKFEQETTEVAKLNRFGAAIGAGRHHGWTWLLGFDTSKFSDDDRLYSLGAELWYDRKIGLRLGYELDGDDVGGFTFGLGVGLWRLVQPHAPFDVRFDLAQSPSSGPFQARERSSVVVYPTGPEPFGMIYPPNQYFFKKDLVELNWEEAEDPDPYDDLTYAVMLDTSYAKVDAAGEALRQIGNYDSFAVRWQDNLLALTDTLSLAAIETLTVSGERYYWGVAAFDRDRHVVRGHGSGYVREFSVWRPDLVVESVEFKPHPKIKPLSDPTQGHIVIKVKNIGKGDAAGGIISLLAVNLDSLARRSARDSITIEPDSLLMWNQDDQIWRASVSFSETLGPWKETHAEIRDAARKFHGEEYTIHFESDSLKVSIPWDTDEPGKYRFLARVELANSAAIENRDSGQPDNNVAFADLYSIPKWNADKIEIASKQTFNVMARTYDAIELPIIPAVFFEPGSDKIRYSHADTVLVDSLFPGVEMAPVALAAVAQRMQKQPDSHLLIKGYVDPISDLKTLGDGMTAAELARRRALKVRELLVQLGVAETTLHADKAQNHTARMNERRPESGSDDAVRINEENRRVELHVARKNWEEALFKPVNVRVSKSIVSDLPSLCANVIVPAGVEDTYVKITEGKNSVRRSFEQVHLPDSVETCQKIYRQAPEAQLIRSVTWWDGLDSLKALAKLNRTYKSSVLVKDGQGHLFETEPDEFTLASSEEIIKEEIFTLFEFDKTSSIFPFYDERLDSLADEFLAYIQTEDDLPAVIDSSGAQLRHEFRIRFEGHADEIGREDYNLKLSDNRAQTLTQRFERLVTAKARKYGLPPRMAAARIDAHASFGEEEPFGVYISGKYHELGKNRDPLGRNLNRRVLVRIYDKAQPLTAL